MGNTVCFIEGDGSKEGEPILADIGEYTGAEKEEDLGCIMDCIGCVVCTGWIGFAGCIGCCVGCVFCRVGTEEAGVAEAVGLKEDKGGTIEIGVEVEPKEGFGSSLLKETLPCSGIISLKASLKSSSLQPPPAKSAPFISARVRPLDISPRMYPKSSGVIIIN